MAEDKELAEIMKLPPKERLKRLKELEEKRKKQEEEAKKLMNKIMDESLSEIKLDEMLKEIEVPRQKQVDVDKLFEQSEGIDEKAKATVRLSEKPGEDYAKSLQNILPKETVREIQEWYSNRNVPVGRDQFLEVYNQVREAYDNVRQGIQKVPGEEYSTMSERVVEEVLESKRILRAMGYKMKWFEQSSPPPPQQNQNSQ